MERKKLKIEMDVTESQAITINQMIKQWNQLSSLGGSRYVAFFADGDGNFHPNGKVESEWDLKANEDLGVFAVEKYKEGVIYMDFDPVSCILSHRRNNSEEFVQEQLKLKEVQLRKDFHT